MKKIAWFIVFILLVPGVALARFTDNGNGTIRDTRTGLMWQQANAPGTYDWKQALAYCENLSLGGYSNWRMPTLKELKSIVDYGIPYPGPCINTNYFPNTQASFYWSSTTEADYTLYAWGVDLSNGSGYSFYKSNSNYVRAVRGGQSGLLGDLVILGGRVVAKDANGNAVGPLAGATVEISGNQTAVTDGQGKFRFENPAPGTYIVTASKTGYYPQTKSIALQSGSTKDEIFYLMAQQSDKPAVSDFQSPSGRYFIEKMPADLNFAATVAWNGTPGTVRFLIAGQWIDAATTDLGNGLARTEVTTPPPASIASCSELTIAVVNGEGEETYVSSGIHFYPVPELIRQWFDENIDWLSGAALTWSSEENKPSMLIPQGMELGPFQVDGYNSVKKNLRFDLLAGTFSGDVNYALGAKFATGTPLSHVRFLGEASGNAGGGLEIALAGCQPPRLNPYWNLGVSGKAGVGVPAVVFVELVVPPVAPAINFLLGIPVVGKVVGSLETRFYFVFGLDFKGSYGLYPNIELGDKFLWAKKVNGTGTVGLEIQAVLELYKASAGMYGGGTISLPTELPLSISKIRGYAGVFAGYKLFQYKKKYGVEFSFEKDTAKAVRYILLGKDEGMKWEPIGNSTSAWGKPNRLPDVKIQRQIASLKALDATVNNGVNEQVIVENVTTVATPSLIADADETAVAFTAYDTDKPWYEATDIGEAQSTDGQAWTINPVTDDLAAEFSPQMATVSQTATLCAWTRAYGDVSGAQEPGDIAPYEEIVASFKDRNTGVWRSLERITNNTQVDRDPKPVIFGSNQGICWIQNEGALEMGNADKGDSLLFSPWDGSSWGSAQTLWAGKKGILDFSFTADGDGQGHIVFNVDEDGDQTTTDDQELYRVSTANNIWQTAVRLTDDATEDNLPVLVAPENVPMLVWKAGGTLKYTYLDPWDPKDVYIKDTLANEAPTLDGATMPGGAAIAYTVQSPEGVDIVAAFYDAALDQWSLPVQLTHDEDAESSLCLAFDGDELVMAYLKTQTLRQDIDIEIDGQMQHIENVPQPGRTDLYVLRHALGNDLSVDAAFIVFTPENPAPGTTAGVKVTVENHGDLPVENVLVSFYDGDPDDGGTLIAESTVTGPVVAGDSAEVAISWVMPTGVSAHHIYVVADPSLSIDDRNRANNTASAWTTLPDPIIETASSDLISDTTISLTAKVVNMGVIPSGSFDVAWHLNAPDGPEIGRSTVEILIPGAGNDVTYLWDVAPPVQPDHFISVYVVVDPEKVVPEFNETNNNAFQSVETPMYTDQVGTLTVDIFPLDAVTAGVKWSIDNGVSWYDSGTAVTLLSGSYTVVFRPVDDWVLPAVENVVVATGKSVEITGREVAAGDINNDGVVDLTDLILAIGITAQKEFFDVEIHAGADVNGDNRIDLAEVVYIARKLAGMEAPSAGVLIKSSVLYNSAPSCSASDLDNLVGGFSDFTVDFYHAVAADPEFNGKNIFFSGYSIENALAMTWAGAKNNTAAEMTGALHLALPQETFHSTLNALNVDINSRDDQPPPSGDPFSLNVINAVWSRIGYPFLDGYLDVIAQNYDAGVRTLDFYGNPDGSRQIINGWVEDQTHEKIKDLLSEGSITSDTAVVLTNAVYFKASWFFEFNENLTAPHDFTRLDGTVVPTPMMHQVLDTRYVKKTLFDAVALPYVSPRYGEDVYPEELSMLVIIPQTGQFEAVEASLLDGGNVDAIVSSLAMGEVDLGLPKFEFECEVKCRDILQGLGMVDAFDPSVADFSGMVSPAASTPWIDQVYHKAYVAVDEQGTEAAAATAVVIKDTAVPDPAVILADKPFIFLIRDNTTGLILFMGRVLDPTE